MSYKNLNQREDATFLLSSSPEWGSPMTNHAQHLADDDQAANHFIRSNNFDDEYPFNDEEDDLSPSRSLSNSAVTEDFTVDFFRPLQQAEPEARAPALESIIELLRHSLKTEKKELLKAHLATIVRLSTEVPFDDVISAFTKLLREIELHGITIPKARTTPSSFVQISYFPPINTIDPIYRQLFTDVFLQTGRVSHLNRILLLHPTYYEKYWMQFSFIMRDNGPLPIDWRWYLGILAAARHQCKWLMFVYEIEFKLTGGNEQWLKGIDHIPKKLYNILELNQLLNHQPWLITKEHIANLVKGEDSWSIGELVHAMIIICHIKSLSGIAFGCGVTPESDMPDFQVSDEQSTEEEEAVPTAVKADTDKIMELLKQWEMNEPEELTQEHFVKAESETANRTVQSSFEPSDVSRFIGNFKLKHEDFDVHARNYSIFRVQDYFWKEHGFELVRRFLPDAATLLDEEFDHIYNMTYNMFSQSKDIDTFPFRRAIWQYVQRLKGMFHDDYNYQEVNVFLNIVSKSYIKKITCQPETATKSDFANLGYDLKPDEKVHVALLAVESSKQSELLYGLHAVMQHMYNR